MRRTGRTLLCPSFQYIYKVYKNTEAEHAEREQIEDAAHNLFLIEAVHTEAAEEKAKKENYPLVFLDGCSFSIVDNLRHINVVISLTA